MKIDSRKIFWVLMNVGLLVLIVFLVYGLKALARYSSSLGPARVIYVSAEGKAVAVPDIAKVSFAVVSEGVSPAEIQKENTEKMNNALRLVKEQGIEEKDIKTTQYSLSPRYEYDEKRKWSFIVGYELRQSVELKIRNFSKISPILAGLPELGINEIGQLQFDVDSPDEYQNQARKEAFAKARVKAESMAEQNGTRIRRVVTFSESFGYWPPPTPFAAKEGFGGGLEAVPQPIIEPGTQEVTAQVNVTYEIR